MKLLRFLLPLLLFAPLAAQAQTFPKLSGRVVDAANLLSPEQEAQLSQLSDEVEKASSRQFVVATIPDLEGYPIEDYGYRLGREWKIGQSEANNGILLIVAPTERKVRIEVGYGLEPIMTDALSHGIVQDTILPSFRAGDMAGGIVAGANEIGEQMKLPLEAAEARAKQKIDARPVQRNRSGNGDGSGLLFGVFGVVLFFVVVLPMLLGRGQRGRRYRRGMGQVGQVILWSAIDAALRGGGRGGGSSWGGGDGGWGGGGGGGFSGGGGSFGGGGASGSW